jgi:alpha-beta hydrolase superfamily lysophospholipase
MSKYAAVTTSPACWYSGFAEFRGFPKGKALKLNWRSDRWVQQFAREAELGVRPITKPLLVISGEADQTVPIDAVRRTVGRACSMGSALYFKSYPGLDHDPTMTESVPAQITWMRERFAGSAMTNICPQL